MDSWLESIFLWKLTSSTDELLLMRLFKRSSSRRMRHWLQKHYWSSKNICQIGKSTQRWPGRYLFARSDCPSPKWKMQHSMILFQILIKYMTQHARYWLQLEEKHPYLKITKSTWKKSWNSSLLSWSNAKNSLMLESWWKRLHRFLKTTSMPSVSFWKPSRSTSDWRVNFSRMSTSSFASSW